MNMADRNVRKENQEGKGTMTGMDDGMDFIAHVCQDEKGNGLPPHPLEQHLLNTAELAGKFASKFNSGLWGNWLASHMMLEKGGVPGNTIIGRRAAILTRKRIWKESPEKWPMPFSAPSSLKRFTVSRLVG